jgi:pimeloyl-ACP methyl ester carboxylesterase
MAAIVLAEARSGSMAGLRTLAIGSWWYGAVLGNNPDVAVRLPYIPPLWREGLAGLEYAALMRSGIWRGAGVTPGDGRPVLLIPGFLAGDGSLVTLTRWLRANGYRTSRAGIRANIDCSAEACARLETRLEALAAESGQRVAIVGQSRGGTFARVLAARRPDLVAGIVTLGAPTVSQLRVHPVVLAHVGVVGALGSARVPGMFRLSCLRGECCREWRDACLHPVEVPYTALYSKSDGIVDWRSCLDPEAECVEVRASHLGMGLNAEVYAELAHALGRLATLPRTDLAHAA